ncbi:FAD/NAD(P)-binding domain-containing protein [Acephala macrosclerotiorum]|nr:FAD/NAD(P)-binding domain-containing protein [Acephala macrosclerotiorum]
MVGSGPGGGTLGANLPKAGQSVLLLEFLAVREPLMRWDFFIKYHSNDTINDLYEHLTWRTKEGLPRNMRQYFVRLENDHVVPKGTRGYGFDGFLNITANAAEFLKNQTQATKVLQATTKIISQEPSKIFEPVTNGTDFNNDDPNRDQGVGLFGFPAHRDPLGRRVSARTAVFEVWNASNPDSTKKYPLTVSLNSLATKVLFDRSGKLPRAIGVEYLLGQSMYSADPRYNCSSSGAKKQVFARMEIIVLGGIFNTPQLLILSGIGPKVDLQNLSIEVIIDLPGVGTNLQDNLEMGVVAFSANKTFTFDGPICTFGAPGDPCLAEWYEGKGHGDFHGYWPSEAVNNATKRVPGAFDFSMAKMHSNNRFGTLKLRSNNPRDTPLMIDQFPEGIGLGRSIFDSLTAAKNSLAPFMELSPCKGNRGCDIKDSCSIGSDSDPLAVLDSKFRVRGTEGLRVVDASAFPRTPGVFPVLPTFMLSMKASEVILQAAESW